MPVGAGRRKNKNAAAGEKQKGKVAISEGLDTSGYVPFGPLLGLDQGLGYPGSVGAAGKGALGPFMPTLPQLGALAYPPVDPSMAAAAAAALPSRLAAGMNPAQFCAHPSTSQRSSQAAAEDGSRNGRRVRMRKNDGEAARPADSSQHGSASTATEMPCASAGGMARSRGVGGGEQCMSGGMGDASGGAGGLLSFQPFQGPSFAGASGGYGQPAMSSPMTADWYSMAAAAGQQQAAAQQQLQYQAAAAMQAQALQAAAAGWSQGSNPYMSGLCFPYNFYSANPQLAAAYARSAARPSHRQHPVLHRVSAC